MTVEEFLVWVESPDGPHAREHEISRKAIAADYRLAFTDAARAREAITARRTRVAEMVDRAMRARGSL